MQAALLGLCVCLSSMPGMGDSLVVGTLLPILLGIALGLSGGGSVLGPIFFILVWNIGMFFIMRFLFFMGLLVCFCKPNITAVNLRQDGFFGHMEALFTR